MADESMRFRSKNERAQMKRRKKGPRSNSPIHLLQRVMLAAKSAFSMSTVTFFATFLMCARRRHWQFALSRAER